MFDNLAHFVFRRLPLAIVLIAATNVDSVGGEAKRRPIQALLVTGGCCHDYDRQKLILTRGISARADVRWTVVQQGGTTTDTLIPLYNDANWADGFDIVVHNECFANVNDKAFVDRILAPHQKGTPAILIHCAMHCYRVGDNRWFKFVGMESPRHGSHYSFSAEDLLPDHPIMKGFGDAFVVPKGELYFSTKMFETATPLAHAKRKTDGVPQVCVWTNDYNGTRVFGTTIGHYNESMAEPKYLDMLTKGLLWAVGRDAEKEFHPTSDAVNESINQLVGVQLDQSETNVLPQNCCGDGNLAFKKRVTAKSEQSGNFARHLTDGLLDTRWCADSSQETEWVVVDLEKPHHVRAIRLHWERPRGSAYRYCVEASVDQENWNQIVDASENKNRRGIQTHKVDSPDTQFLRVTFLGNDRGLWASLWELEASADVDLPVLPKVVRNSRGNRSAPSTAADVKAPPGFNVTLFASPPEVNYPTCVTAAATGEVFVGIDEQGSLGKDKGRGRVVRCIDTDGDGVADRINEFAKMDHPRGLVYDSGSLWVLHPPFLTLYRDVDNDGKADENDVLIEGISTKEVGRRGADHTTNGIQIGIDGWIYIAVGDYGFNKAIGRDGTTLSRRGGGVVRVRPDGTGMEIYSWGQRNIMDIAIDPMMNVFTRDNTNDGGGWDIRLSHVIQSANYGYPSLYKNFTEETMPPLADFGGGSGCGAMFFQDARWPAGFNNSVLTCDWGRSEVYRHNLPSNGATFDAHQEVFLKVPRPTDIDADASGRLYVTSWKNGGFKFDQPDVGFVAMITPDAYIPQPVKHRADLSEDELIRGITSDIAALRLHCQREILWRCQNQGLSGELGMALVALAARDDASAHARAAAVFTIGQLDDERVSDILRTLAVHPEIRECCIRTLGETDAPIDELTNSFILGSLDDSDLRVQAAALIAIGRMPDMTESVEAMNKVLGMTTRTRTAPQFEGDAWRSPDPGRVIPHLAVQTLIKLHAIKPCIVALDGPHRDGALWALKSLHDPETIRGLFAALGSTRDEQLRRSIWTTLIRLYFREGEFTEDSPKWWGTRPDTTGPYYDRVTWSESNRIAEAIKTGLSEADEALRTHINDQLKRHVVKLDGVERFGNSPDEEETAIQLPIVDATNPDQIANMDFADIASKVMSRDGDAEAGRKLFRSQACVSCHTFANGQKAKGPHLVDIGKRYSKPELIESIVTPSKKIAQGFDTWSIVTTDGKIETGFVVLESAETITLRRSDGLSIEVAQDDVEDRIKQETSMMPAGVVGNLTVDQLADLIAYLQSLH